MNIIIKSLIIGLILWAIIDVSFHINLLPTYSEIKHSESLENIDAIDNLEELKNLTIQTVEKNHNLKKLENNRKVKLFYILLSVLVLFVIKQIRKKTIIKEKLNDVNHKE